MKKIYQPELVAQHVPREDLPPTVEARLMRPGELLAAQDAVPIAFLPLGTLEWHGRHNPIGCDAMKAEALCKAVAEITGGVVFPPLYYGSDSYFDAGHGMGNGMDAVAGFALPGSFYRIPDELFVHLLIAACGNILSRGFSYIYMVSGHNAQIQRHLMNRVAANFANEDGDTPIEAMFEFDPMPEGILRTATGDHAGGYETAMMLYLRPERVNLLANDGMEVPELAQSNAFPMSQTSAEMGKVRFEAQLRGFTERVNKKINQIKGRK